MDIKKELIKAIKKQVDVPFELEVPPDSKFGDFALPCFDLAKKAKKSPQGVAGILSKNIKSPLIERMEVKGPYLNFFLKNERIVKATLAEILKEKHKYGFQRPNKKKVVVEYCAPNTNKPLHLGHIRNMVLGSSLSLLLRAIGYKVVEVNLNNDRGVHICKSMLAYKKYGNNKQPDKKSDHFVGDFYVLFNQKVKQFPEIEEEVQKMLRDWEDGRSSVVALWKKMNRWAFKGFNQTYKSLGIKFDKEYYESDYYNKGKEIVLEGLKRGIFEKEKDGNIIVDLDEFKLPKKVLLRADETSVYVTQDLYLADLKFKDFNPEKSIYVVGNEQNLHFKQLFAILKLLKHKAAERSVHFGYGLVHLPEGRMKSREGTVVDADDLIEEVIDNAKHEIKLRYKHLSTVEVTRRSKMIGLGALKFFMLKIDPLKDMTYNPKDSVSFEGETGPYVQYAHARCCSILKKEKKRITSYNPALLTHGAEVALVKTLASFPEVVQEAANDLRPSTLVHYMIKVVRSFNDFYRECPVLTAEPEVQKARLKLVDATRIVLKNGLSLFGIDVPREM